MQKIFLFSLILMIFSGSARAEDAGEFALVMAIASTGPLTYCAYKAAHGSKPARAILKFAAFAFSLCGTIGTSVFAVASPNLSPLKRSCCAAAAVLLGISTCVSAEMYADEFKSYAPAAEEVEG